MNKELFKILVCPQCKKLLTFHKSDLELVCDNCRLNFPINNNIPEMSEARPIMPGDSSKTGNK